MSERGNRYLKTKSILIDGATFPSIAVAAAHLSVSPSALSKALKAGRKCNGHIVKYAEGGQGHEPRAKLILIDGVTFPTIAAGAAYLSVSTAALSNALKKGRLCRGHIVKYADDNSPFVEPQNRRQTAVFVDGVLYPSFRAAAKAVSVSSSALSRAAARGKPCEGHIVKFADGHSPHMRECAICGKPFPCYPSDKKKTCSETCERKLRAKSQSEIAHKWGDEAKKRLSALGQTPNLTLGLAAVMKIPEFQRGPQNRESKVWELLSPDGERYTVVDLLDWARRNADLFGKPLGDESAVQIRTGFGAIKQGRVATYKGWQLLGCYEKTQKDIDEFLEGDDGRHPRL